MCNFSEGTCVSRGMFPANQLARKHPFILNARIEPLQWAKMAVRGRLPGYAWGAVLADIKKYTGRALSLLSTSAPVHVACAACTTRRGARSILPSLFGLCVDQTFLSTKWPKQ